MGIKEILGAAPKTPYQGLVVFCTAAYPPKAAGAYRRLNFYVKAEDTAGDERGTRCSWLNPPEVVTEKMVSDRALVLTGHVDEYDSKRYLEVTQVHEYPGPELPWMATAKAQPQGGGGRRTGGGGWKPPLPKFDPIEAGAQLAWAKDAMKSLREAGVESEAAGRITNTILMKYGG